MSERWIDAPEADGFWVDQMGIVWLATGQGLVTVNRGTDEQWEFEGPVRRLSFDDDYLDDEGPGVAESEEIRGVGDFAARWNAMRSVQRAEWLWAILSNSRWAHRCLMDNHDGRIAVLEAQRHQQVSAARSLAEEIADRVLVTAGVDRDALVRTDQALVSVRSLMVDALRVVSRG